MFIASKFNRPTHGLRHTHLLALKQCFAATLPIAKLDGKYSIFVCQNLKCQMENKTKKPLPEKNDKSVHPLFVITIKCSQICGCTAVKIKFDAQHNLNFL